MGEYADDQIERMVDGIDPCGPGRGGPRFREEAQDERNAELTVHFIRQTDKAIQVDDGDGEHWLPKSQITCETAWGQLERDDMINVIVPMWLAVRKGMV